MIEISLSREKVALIDDADLALVNQYKWSLSAVGYAVTNIWKDGEHSMLYMHRLILDAKPGEEVDHRSGDKLNNRRSNLRKCSHAQNQQNRKAIVALSGAKGVQFDVDRKKWKARIQIDGVQHFLGRFATRDEAIAAYDTAAREAWGEFAAPNSEIKCGSA